MHRLIHFSFSAAAASLSAQNLRIYAIDVEGGKSTLVCFALGRIDADRYWVRGQQQSRCQSHRRRGCHSAGVKRIDYLVITHYHGDHAGGVPQLAAKMPIGKIFDHGDSFEQSNAKTQAVFQPYAAMREKYPHARRCGRAIPFPSRV